MPGPADSPILAGLRVVELSAFVAAPLGGATLAALGADVIRVDPPGGGIDIDRWPLHRGRSLYWAGLNQGKRSVTIDTRTEVGQRQVAGLITAPGEGGGIVLTNLPVKGWSSYEELSRLRRDLIMVVITGDRDGGIAVDYTVNAAVGFPWLTGPEGHEGPVNHVLPAWDGMTGYLAALAILAACGGTGAREAFPTPGPNLAATTTPARALPPSWRSAPRRDYSTVTLFARFRG